MYTVSSWRLRPTHAAVQVRKPKFRDPRFEESSTTALKGAAAADARRFLAEKRAGELEALGKAISKERRRRGGRAGPSPRSRCSRPRRGG